MSNDFRVALAAPVIELGELAVRFRDSFSASGFANSKLVRAAIDPKRGVLDETWPDEDLALTDPDFRKRVATWQGWSCEYWSESLDFYVIAGRLPGHTNLWIDISERTLRDLIDADELRRFVSMLLTAAQSSDASVGFGHVEIYREPLTPAQMIAAIGSLPLYPGEPACLGLLSARDWSFQRAKSEWGAQFDITVGLTGHLVLLIKDFVETFGSAKD